MCNRIILNDRTLSSSNILQLLETIIETKNINSYYLPLSVLSQHIPVIFPSPTRHVLRCQERTQRGTVAPRKLPLLGDFRITSHGEITYHFIGFSTINHGKQWEIGSIGFSNIYCSKSSNHLVLIGCSNINYIHPCGGTTISGNQHSWWEALQRFCRSFQVPNVEVQLETSVNW